MTSDQFVNKYGEPFFKDSKLVSFYNDVQKLNSEKIKALESQLKEAKELLENAQPIWKENCAKWAHWYKRLKELI